MEAPSPVGSSLLQRKCACGGNPGASGECEECRRKRLAGPGNGIQAWDGVNRPGDRWEAEAERVAESVLADHAPHPVSRDASPQQPLMRAAVSTPALGDVPPGVRETLASAGQPLDADVRDFMETRFGHDFSHVRVHTGQRAAESARDVDALAYTAGRNIVFGAGQYAPDTHSGRRLIAHELAHTIQQGSGMPPVRRQTTPFSVSGLYQGRGEPGEANFVYFDLGRPSPADNPPQNGLDPAEEDKVRDKASEAVAANDQEISLYGYASEEGGASVNTPLIERRLNAVQNVLDDAGFRLPRTVHRQHNLGCSAGKYDYRYWRVIEMQRGRGAATRTCTPSATQPTACAADRAADLETIRVAAHKLIIDPNGALARLDRYLQDQTSEPDVAAALDLHFGNDHSVQTATDVRDRVDAVRATLEALSPSGAATFLCGTMDEPTCNTGSPANANRPAQSITICPTFFTNPDYSSRQEEILLHESSHISSFASDDRAYQAERVILILTTQQALDNAQSITNFILEMNNRARPLGPEHPDQVQGCNPRRERLIREALAWAQRWNKYAMYGTAQTYGNANNTAAMTDRIKDHFGRSDLAAIAGIYDRYRAMDGWFKLFYNVRCRPARHCSAGRSAVWTLTRAASPSGGGPLPLPQPAPTGSGAAPSSAASAATTAASSSPAPVPTPAPSPATPAGDIVICPQFFNLATLYDRTVEMYSGLAVHMPGVSEGRSRSYARLAYNYKTEFWGVL
jgi:hypothetical protein